MELRSLLRILLARWWIVIPTFLITVGAAVVFTIGQERIYEASTRLIVKPNAGLEGDVLSALSIVSRQSEIVDTYAQIANSPDLRRLAGDQLGLTPNERAAIDAEGRLITGTILLEITVRSPNPAIARDYANALSDQLIDYVGALGDAFQLASVFDASAPNRPVLPNVPLNLALGVGLGALLSTGLAVTTQLLVPGPRPHALADIVDQETSAYNRPFFVFRLRQEMSRVRRVRSGLVLALINVNHRGMLDGVPSAVLTEALRRVAVIFDTHLRTEDLAARIDESTFALLLPDTSEGHALPIVEGLRARIAVPALGVGESGQPVHANPAAGIVEYRGDPVSDEDLLERARRALRDAETAPIGRTEVFSGAGARSA